MSREGAILTQLNNGLRVVTHRVPKARAAEITVCTLAGARDEVTGGFPRGTLHWLEHGFCYGSQQYPLPPRRLIRKIKGFRSPSVGGRFNIAAGLAFTTCYARVPRAAVGYSLDIMGALFSQPNLHEDHVEVHTERDVIQIETTENDFDFASLATYIGYGKHPLLHPVIGSEDGIDAASIDTLRAIHAQNFLGGRTVVAVEGSDIKHDDIVAAVERRFALPPGLRPPSEIPIYTGGDARYPLAGSNAAGHTVPLKGTHMAVAFKAPCLTDFKAGAALQVARNLLDEPNDESEHSLFYALRDRGSIYGVNVGAAQEMDSGLLTIAYKTLAKPGYASRTLNTIRNVLANLADRVDGDSFRRIRTLEKHDFNHLRTCDVIGSGRLAEDVFLHGEVQPLEYYSALRLEVTKKDVRNIVGAMIDNPPTFLATRNISHVPSEEEIQDIFGRPSPSPARSNFPHIEPVVREDRQLLHA
jgi:predicted Zn-dependent peptidase